LTARLDKTILSEKMIKQDLSRAEESATKSTYRLGIGFERCEKKDEKSAHKFAPSSSYHSNQPKPIIHPIQSHPSTQREV
jgi:hypothetical protein